MAGVSRRRASLGSCSARAPIRCSARWTDRIHRSPVSTVAARSTAYSMLSNKGLIRVGIGIPANAEFTLAAVDDLYGYASAAQLSLFGRPPPSTNLGFLSAVMWDERERELKSYCPSTRLLRTRPPVDSTSPTSRSMPLSWPCPGEDRAHHGPATRDRGFRAGRVHRSGHRRAGRTAPGGRRQRRMRTAWQGRPSLSA